MAASLGGGWHAVEQRGAEAAGHLETGSPARRSRWSRPAAPGTGTGGRVARRSGRRPANWRAPCRGLAFSEVGGRINQPQSGGETTGGLATAGDRPTGIETGTGQSGRPQAGPGEKDGGEAGNGDTSRREKGRRQKSCREKGRRSKSRRQKSCRPEGSGQKSRGEEVPGRKGVPPLSGSRPQRAVAACRTRADADYPRT